ACVASLLPMDIKALAAVTAAALVRTSRRVIWFMSFLPGLTRVSPEKTPRVAFYSYHRFLFRDEKNEVCSYSTRSNNRKAMGKLPLLILARMFLLPVSQKP